MTLPALSRAAIWCSFAAVLGAQSDTASRILDLADPETRRAAQIALLADVSACAAELGAVVAHGDPRVVQGDDAAIRSGAVAVLVESGSRGVAAIDDLVVSLSQPIDKDVRRQAVVALSRILPFAGERRDELRQRIERRDLPLWHLERGWLLDSLSADGFADVPALVEQLGADDSMAVIATCEAIRERAGELRGEARLRATLERLFESEIADREWQPRAVDVDRRNLMTRVSLALASIEPGHRHGWLGACDLLFRLDPVGHEAALRQLRVAPHVDAVPWLCGAARVAPPDLAARIVRVVTAFGPRAIPYGADLRDLANALPSDLADRVWSFVRVLDVDEARSAHDGAVFALVGVGIENEAEVGFSAAVDRLQRWLATDDHRARVQEDPTFIRHYHEACAASPRPAAVRWLPRKVLPSVASPLFWSRPEEVGGTVLASRETAVGPQRERREPLPWLVELLPSDPELATFDEADIALIEMEPGWARYWISDQTRPRYLRYLQELERRGSVEAVLVDGVVVYLDSLGRVRLDREKAGYCFFTGPDAGRLRERLASIGY